MRDTTIIVSGASGFIGRRLAARLQNERPQAGLHCLVKPVEDPFCWNGVDYLKSRQIVLTPLDLTGLIDRITLARPDVLFHLAANTHTWEPNQDCNDVGTANLIRALGPLGVDTHIVFTSTTAVMDNRSDLKKPLDAVPLGPSQPFSRYGQSKWRAERFLRDEAARQGFRLSIVRLCTVYGPQPRPNTLFDALSAEVSKRSIASRLNWPGLTSFIHVDDVVSCLMQIGDTPPRPGCVNTYLLAAESRTLSEVSRLVYEVRGLVYQMVRVPEGIWKWLGNVHRLCLLGSGVVPTALYNSLWRFNILVNPVFHCNTALMRKWFPALEPKLLAESLHEVWA